MRILLIGANGQLGQDLQRAFEREEIIAVTHAQLEISDETAVRDTLEAVRPDCVFNTAVFHGVELCERQPDRAFAANATGVLYLARAAERLGAALVHFSTDYVFDGTKDSPYVETDRPAPLSLYAISKLAGEWAVQRSCEKYFLIRTSTLFGPGGRGRGRENFVETMLRLAAAGGPVRGVTDQRRSPTSSRDLAEKLAPLLASRRYGLYHMTNAGGCSWYEFAREIFQQKGLQTSLVATTSEELGIRASRPANSTLDHQALREAGIPDFRPWQEALADYLRCRLE